MEPAGWPSGVQRRIEPSVHSSVYSSPSGPTVMLPTNPMMYSGSSTEPILSSRSDRVQRFSSKVLGAEPVSIWHPPAMSRAAHKAVDRVVGIRNIWSSGGRLTETNNDDIGFSLVCNAIALTGLRAPFPFPGSQPSFTSL